MPKTIHPAAAICACLLLSAPALAQELPAIGAPESAAGLSLELNALKPTNPADPTTGCQVTLLASNQLGAALDRVTYDLAFFDQGGSIDRLLAVEFKGLAAGKTKVIQFPLDGLACDNISRVLINNATFCEGAGVQPAACLEQLTTSTKPAITFGV